MRSLYKSRKECKGLEGYKDLAEQYHEIVWFWKEVTKDVALDPELMIRQYADYLNQLASVKANRV